MPEIGGGSSEFEAVDESGVRRSSAPSVVPLRNTAPAPRPALHSKRVISDAMAALDFSMIVLSALLAKWLYLAAYRDGSEEIGAYFVIGLVGGFTAVVSFRNQQLYSFEALTVFRGQTRRILVGLGTTALILLSVGYMLKISAEFSRGWMISWFLFSIVLLMTSRYLGKLVLGRWIAAGLFARNVAIYGGGEIAERLIEHLSLQGEGMRVIGVFDDPDRAAKSKVLVAGGLSELIRIGQLERIDEVLIALPLSDDRRIANLLEQLSILPADIRLCPDMAAFRIRPRGIVNYNGVSVLELARRPLDDWAPIIKMAEDRILAGLLLLLVAPVMLAIALAIKLDSKGPVFFRQRRHGFNHHVFSVLKFRTMFVSEDGPAIRQAQQNDTRVTSVGRFLRRTSLDELPQLLNVMKGEMSLVGPRPHALAHNEYYSTLVGRYANRHKMKPGITGWAQINGFRGETDTPEKMRKRVECDLFYIENWSPWLDFKILALTPFLGLFHKNAY